MTYLRRSLDERKVEESVASVLEQLLEGDDQTPGVGPMDDQPLQQDSDNLLTDIGSILLGVVHAKETKNGKAEEVGMAIRIA